jgi:hypothetical protein
MRRTGRGGRGRRESHSANLAAIITSGISPATGGASPTSSTVPMPAPNKRQSKAASSSMARPNNNGASPNGDNGAKPSSDDGASPSSDDGASPSSDDGASPSVPAGLERGP